MGVQGTSVISAEAQPKSICACPLLRLSPGGSLVTFWPSRKSLAARRRRTPCAKPSQMQILPERRQPNDQTHSRGRLPPGQPLLRPGPGPGRPAAAGAAGAPRPPGPACPGAGGRPGAPLRRPAGRAADLPGDRPGPWGRFHARCSLPRATTTPIRPSPCMPPWTGRTTSIFFPQRPRSMWNFRRSSARSGGAPSPPPTGRTTPWRGGQGGLRPHLQGVHRWKRTGLPGPGTHPPV